MKYQATPEKLLYEALKKEKFDIFSYLLKYGSYFGDLNEIRDVQPLFVAIKSDNIDVVKLLLEYGVNINFEAEFKKIVH